MVDTATKTKLEIVTFDNKTKCGIDVADQMTRQYTVKAGTGRWPVVVFYNILDLAYINAYVLYKKKTGDAISRKNFMFQLATKLREAHVQGMTAALAAVCFHFSTILIKNRSLTEAESESNAKLMLTVNKTKLQNSFVDAVDQFSENVQVVLQLNKWTV